MGPGQPVLAAGARRRVAGAQSVTVAPPLPLTRPPGPLRTCPSRALEKAKGILPSRLLPSRPVSSAASLGEWGTSRRLVMTKEGSFKRAVRQPAQATGLRYTEARAALEKG